MIYANFSLVWAANLKSINDDYFVMEIPAAADYTPIREKLMELEENNIITYAEPNLSKNHWY